jgi:uncharacterized membrane protein HdeD (DUF308 family)
MFMDQVVTTMAGHSVLFMVMSGVSLVTFLGSLVAVPWIIGRMPTDYFIRSRQRQVRPLMLIARNVLGLVFVAAGIIMLVTPGQGLLTILVGLLIMSFPGKMHLQRRLLMVQGLRKALNWVRKRQGSPPMVFDPPD